MTNETPGGNVPPEQTIAELEAQVARLTTERDRMEALLADALTHTPKSYNNPIVELLKQKATANQAKE